MSQPHPILTCTFHSPLWLPQQVQLLGQWGFHSNFAAPLWSLHFLRLYTVHQKKFARTTFTTISMNCSEMQKLKALYRQWYTLICTVQTLTDQDVVLQGVISNKWTRRRSTMHNVCAKETCYIIINYYTLLIRSRFQCNFNNIISLKKLMKSPDVYFHFIFQA